MLNFDVKRKINILRDILVGKIPDPKSQVEQITIAMIYKFMDDMDTEFIGEWGGKRKFFVNTDKVNYEKYAWSNIMQQQVSGEERSLLYREGIENMPNNPNLPQLFRDIFRNAYIPFRDSETINMFLKEINDFKYDNSEDLGNAFEMLLSIMGSQGDAGQFRTPRHVIDMIVNIIGPHKNDTILDPACGTAGFLISAYKYILAENRDKDEKIILTADEKTKLTNSLVGYDISQDMVRLSHVNMYLHNFPDPKIYEYDTLTSQDRWDDTFDVILANPPFMTPKGGINPHNRFSVQAKRSEVLFVDYMAEHLNPNGRAGIIVPEGIVFQTANAYKDLRKMLVDNDYLYAVISLPTGVFNPYSGVRTSILLLDKALAKKTDKILFVKIDNDGFDLGAQRREISDNDIPRTVELLKKYKQFIMKGESFKFSEYEEDVGVLATKEKIKDVDYILVGERYKEQVTHHYGKYPMVELGEIVEILDSIRKPLNKSERASGIYPYYGATGIVDYVDNFLFDEKLVLVGEDGAKWGVNEKTAFIVEGKYWVNNHAHVLRPIKNKILNKYLVECLNIMDLNAFITGITVPKLNQQRMKQIQIPLPPLSIQEQIVAVIENYQKIIDGAKQVVDNYKPTIEIDPEWKMVELGEVCEIQSGGTPSKDVNEYWDNGNIPWYTSGEFNDFYTEDSKSKISMIGLQNSSAKISPKGSLLIGMYDTAAFKMSLLDRDASFNQAITGVKPNKKLNLMFLQIYFMQNRDVYLNSRVGARQRNLSKGFISELKVPLPPLSVQQIIVEHINEEYAIINQNKRLIEIFEQKIKDKIAEVWGG